MRLFVAIDFNEHKNYFLGLQHGLSGGLFSFPNSFHLTLKFLGDVVDPKPVAEALSCIGFCDFDLTLSGFGVFPSQKNIRVVWVGLNPITDVANLHSQIDSVLQSPDPKWHPHITIARIKLVRDVARISTSLASKTEPIMTRVNSFALYKSTLTSLGPVYEMIAKFCSSKVI